MLQLESKRYYRVLDPALINKQALSWHGNKHMANVNKEKQCNKM